jgi:hypothetical protein
MIRQKRIEEIEGTPTLPYDVLQKNEGYDGLFFVIRCLLWYNF